MRHPSDRAESSLPELSAVISPVRVANLAGSNLHYRNTKSGDKMADKKSNEQALRDWQTAQATKRQQDLNKRNTSSKKK